MLVEHLVGRREDVSGMPIEPHEILVPVVPQQGMTRALDHQHVEIGAMAVAFFIGADGHFRAMDVHHAIGQAEADIGRPPAPLFPSLELELGDIGDKIGHPHEPRRLGLDHFAAAVEPILPTEAAGE